jgi:hypothetical protein
MTSGGAADSGGEDGRREEGVDACLAVPLLSWSICVAAGH